MDFSDIDLNGLGNILDSLSKEDMENLQKTAQSVLGGSRAEEKHSEEGSGFSFPDVNPELLFKIMNIFTKLQSCSPDPGAKLIYALKPLLSPERQKKADMAAELLKLLSLKDILFSE